MSESFLNGRVTLWAGDCLDVLAGFEDNSFDSCVCDPPYHLTSIVKRFGAKNAKAPKAYDSMPYGGNFPHQPSGGGTGAAFARMSKGFMGKQWDGGDIAFRAETWAAVYRVLKPGGYLIAFSGTRTYHRMACAIEDAGFDVRDLIAFLYGCGFPKSRSMRAIGRPELGTALKPALEPICMARKPLSEGTIAANVLAHGTGAINIDGCRVSTDAPRPALERRKDASLDASRNTYGAGINGSRAVEDTMQGRWPANVLHDGSEEVVGAFPETSSGEPGIKRGGNNGAAYGAESRSPGTQMSGFGDSGSAARFFYSAKADSNDRIGSKHPTVKPVDLMQYLVRLVTPKNGVCLDPFAGTGTTGEAAFREGMRAVLIERESEYQADIRRRMKLCLSGPDERAREGIKAKTADKPVDAGPLFQGIG